MKLRFGQFSRAEEGLEAYKKWHANPMPGVNEMIKECGISNYTIYNVGDKLFAYFEWEGEDFDADMARMAADPNTQAWWDVVKPLMCPPKGLPAGECWANMEEIYHLD